GRNKVNEQQCGFPAISEFLPKPRPDVIFNQILCHLCPQQCKMRPLDMLPKGRESRRHQDTVLHARDKRQHFGNECEPFLVPVQLRPSPFALGERFVAPEMDRLIELADLAREIADQVAKNGLDDRDPFASIKLKKRPHLAGMNCINAFFDNHGSFPCPFPAALRPPSVKAAAQLAIFVPCTASSLTVPFALTLESSELRAARMWQSITASAQRLSRAAKAATSSRWWPRLRNSSSSR